MLALRSARTLISIKHCIRDNDEPTGQLTSELTFDRRPIIPFSGNSISCSWILGLFRSNPVDPSSETSFWLTLDEVLIMLKRMVVTVSPCSGTAFPAAFTRCLMNFLLLISDMLFVWEMSGSLSIAAGFVCPFWSLMWSESLVWRAGPWLLPFQMEVSCLWPITVGQIPRFGKSYIMPPLLGAVRWSQLDLDGQCRSQRHKVHIFVVAAPLVLYVVANRPQSWQGRFKVVGWASSYFLSYSLTAVTGPASSHVALPKLQSSNQVVRLCDQNPSLWSQEFRGIFAGRFVLIGPKCLLNGLMFQQRNIDQAALKKIRTEPFIFQDSILKNVTSLVQIVTLLSGGSATA